MRRVRNIDAHHFIPSHSHSVSVPVPVPFAAVLARAGGWVCMRLFFCVSEMDPSIVCVQCEATHIFEWSTTLSKYKKAIIRTGKKTRSPRSAE